MENIEDNNQEQETPSKKGIKGSLSKMYEDKKSEVFNKAENKLNAMPVGKRKMYFFIVFGILALIIFIRLTVGLTSSLSSSKTAPVEKQEIEQKTEIQKATPDDVMNLDLSDTSKRISPEKEEELKKFMDDIIND